MTINFSKDAKEFIFANQKFIAKESPLRAKQYTVKLIHRIVNMLQFPNIGRVNAVFDDDSIREISLDGMKIIYKIYPKNITVLMVYRYINFDETQLDID